MTDHLRVNDLKKRIACYRVTALGTRDKLVKQYNTLAKTDQKNSTFLKKDNRFWAIELYNQTTIARYGNIGTGGSVTVKRHTSPSKALQFLNKAVQQKLANGYSKATPVVVVKTPGKRKRTTTTTATKSKAKSTTKSKKATTTATTKRKSTTKKASKTKKLPAKKTTTTTAKKTTTRTSRAKKTAASTASSSSATTTTTVNAPASKSAALAKKLSQLPKNQLYRTASGTVKKKTGPSGESEKPLGIVDPKSGRAATGILYQNQGEIFDCMLNLLNLAENNDKYYILQVIEDSSNFYCFSHWGRTGTPGQCQEQGPFANVDDALAVFRDKFKDKTGQEWDDRAHFKQIDGKYDLLKTDYEAMANKKAAKWQYFVHDNVDGKANDWYDYEKDASDIVENVYDNFLANPHLGIRVVKSGQWMYQVDLSKMLQTNVQHHAHTQRQIRRVEL